MSTFVTRIALLVVVSLSSWYRDPHRLAMHVLSFNKTLSAFSPTKATGNLSV